MKRTVCLLAVLSLLAVISLLAACRHEMQPGNLVDTATLANFLTEAHLIESYAETRSMQMPDSTQTLVEAAYDSLYRKYHVTPSAIDSSCEYYILHPQLWEDIYARVTANLRDVRDTGLTDVPGENADIETFPISPVAPLDTAVLGESRRNTLKAIRTKRSNEQTPHPGEKSSQND